MSYKTHEATADTIRESLRVGRCLQRKGLKQKSLVEWVPNTDWFGLQN